MSERISDRSLFEYGVVGLAAMVYVLFTAGHSVHPALRVEFTDTTAVPLKSVSEAPAALDLPPSPTAPSMFTLYQAARDGDPVAAFDLGNIYASGIDGPPDYATALRWFSRAAAQGLPDAQYNLAVFYSKGYGAAKDPERALPLFQAAAGQGLADAQVALGLIYRDGLGVIRDYVKSVEWLTKAAGQGNPNAFALLAVAYEAGYGVHRDQVEALKWLTLAARSGRSDEEFRQYLTGALTPAQQQDATQRADSFKIAPPPAH